MLRAGCAGLSSLSRHRRSLQLAAEEFHALANIIVVAGALDRKDAVPLGFAKVSDAGADIRGVHAAADGHFATADARLFAPNGRRQARAHVLDVEVGEVLAEIASGIPAGRDRR